MTNFIHSYYYNCIILCVSVSAGVITLIKDNKVTCVINGESRYSSIEIVPWIEVKREIDEIKGWMNVSDWKKSNDTSNFDWFSDQRWEGMETKGSNSTEDRYSGSAIKMKKNNQFLIHSTKAVQLFFIGKYKNSSSEPIDVKLTKGSWQYLAVSRENNHTAKLLVYNTSQNISLAFVPEWFQIIANGSIMTKSLNYLFLYSTNPSENENTGGIEIDSSKCIFLYTSVDENCYLDLVIKTTTGDKIQNKTVIGFNRKDQLRKWKPFQIITDSDKPGSLYLYKRKKSNSECYWAVDDIQTCKNETEIYSVTAPHNSTHNYTCRTVNFMNTSRPITNNKFEKVGILYKTSNITCTSILGNSYKHCENHKICLENSDCFCAWGYKGSFCNETCEEGRWGKDCKMKCSDKCENCTKIHGCLNCKNKRSFGNTCQQKLPVLLFPPILTRRTEKSLSFSQNMTYDDGIVEPKNYQIQYKKADEKNFRDYENAVAYPGSKEILNFTMYDINQTFANEIRIILFIAENLSYSGSEVPKLFVYRKSLKAEYVVSDQTLRVNWTETDNSTGHYKIKYNCKGGFCPNQPTVNKTETANNSSLTIELDGYFETCAIDLYSADNKLIDQKNVSPSESSKPNISTSELPKNISFIAYNSTVNEITMELENCMNFHGKLTFDLSFTCTNVWCFNKTVHSPEQLLNLHNETVKIEVKELLPYTNYSVVVTAHRQSYTEKKAFNLTTWTGRPEEIKNLTVSSHNDGAITIQWKDPYPIPGKSYIVRYNKKNKTNNYSDCPLQNNFTCANVTDLKNDTTYNITVQIKYFDVMELGNPQNVTITVLHAISNFSRNLPVEWCQKFCYLFLPDPITMLKTCEIILEEKKTWKNTSIAHCKKNNVIQYETNQTQGVSVSNPSYNLYLKFNDNEEILTLPNIYEKNPNKNISVGKHRDYTFITVFAICALGCLASAILIIVFYKYKKRKVSNRRIPNAFEIYELHRLKENDTSEYLNNNEYDTSPNLINLDEFENYLLTSLEEDPDNNRITRQYESISKTPCKDRQTGQLPENKQKNRYKNVIPYDDTRVSLKDNEGGNDYINANYIDGYNKAKDFIGTQAPSSSTLQDFWHMICQEKVTIIIMLTELRENGLVKCEQYWPEVQSRCRFGKFVIANNTEKIFPNYIIRQLQVTYDDQTQFVQQFQYVTWPDHGNPLCIQDYIAFIKRTMRFPRTSPMVLHCNAGCGRTGTYILSDIILRMAIHEKQVDFPKILIRMREQRQGLVSNVDQYIFVHFVVLEYFFRKDFSIPVTNSFQSKVKDATKPESLAILTEFLAKATKQFQRTMFKVDLQLTEEDKAKNRFSKLLPGHSRIFLPAFSSNEPNYINAVSVDCYRYPKKFIVTQQPLPNTVEDFWKLIKEYEIDTILSLNELQEMDPQCPVFWPKDIDEVWLFGNNLKITFISESSNNIYNTIKLKVGDATKNSKQKVVKIMDVKGWQRNIPMPPSTKHFIRVWKKISKSTNQIVVTCYDGTSASGLFVALAFLLEKLNMDHACDVFTAVKSVRESRPQFVQERDQLIFLYNMAEEYLQEFSTYGNFRDSTILPV